jgi:hypothetical protein
MNRYTIITLAATLPVLGACSAPSAPMDVSEVMWVPSAGGRVEVAFRVTNPGDTARAPECWIRAFDADGFRVGSDKLLGDGDEVAPGVTEVFTGITGIDAADVASVRVEDC